MYPFQQQIPMTYSVYPIAQQEATIPMMNPNMMTPTTAKVIDSVMQTAQQNQWLNFFPMTCRTGEPCHRFTPNGQLFCCAMCQMSHGVIHSPMCDVMYLPNMAGAKNEIRFGKEGHPYFELSNLFVSPFVIDGVSYKTVEHYYQSKKFDLNPEIHSQLVAIPFAIDARNFAMNNMVLVRPDWTQKKNEIMKRALRAKFQQNEKIAKLLKETKDMKLIYDDPQDIYWGSGQFGTGQNWLGKLLMEIREEKL